MRRRTLPRFFLVLLWLACLGMLATVAWANTSIRPAGVPAAPACPPWLMPVGGGCR